MRFPEVRRRAPACCDPTKAARSRSRSGSLPTEAFGSFVDGVPAPLCIGTLELEDGERVKGFLCEAHGAQGALDISGFGGWRGYLEAKRE